MADLTAGAWTPVLGRLARWAGAAALAASLLFIGDRLWRLDWSTLRPHLSGSFVAAAAGTMLFFALADRLLAQAWSTTVDPDRTISRRGLLGIYARGVMLKYLPGSIFQYVSRQVEGAKRGLGHKRLAQSAGVEVGLHLVSSMTAAAAFFLFDRSPIAALLMIAATAAGLFAFRRPLISAMGWQIAAFGLFGLAAALVGVAVFPAGTSLPHFAAIFLLAWLAGFVVPVAPGGIGVREAALLALAGGSIPAAAALAAVLALRLASIGGDLVFGMIVLARRPAE